MHRLLLTPLVLAAVGCAATTDPAVFPTPMPADLVETLNPTPPPPPQPVVRKRAGRTGYSTRIDASTVYAFETDRVYPVSVSPGRNTVIQVGVGEWLTRQPMQGDPDNTKWIVEMTRGAGDFVVVRCAGISSTTNLFFATTRYDYQIDLTCKGKGRGMDRVRWTYPDAVEQVPSHPLLTYDPNTYSRPFDISSTSGDKPEWTPIMVYEKAGKSYIEFPPRLGALKAAPSLNATGGGDIPFRITGGHFYEVDRSITDAELRLGGSVVRIKRVG